MTIVNICSGNGGEQPCGNIACRGYNSGCAIYSYEEECIERGYLEDDPCRCVPGEPGQWNCILERYENIDLGWVSAIIIMATVVLCIFGVAIWLINYRKDLKKQEEMAKQQKLYLPE